LAMNSQIIDFSAKGLVFKNNDFPVGRK